MPRMAAVIVLIVTSWLLAAPAPAQEAKLEVKPTDTVKSILERNVGKRVSLVLVMGSELSGVVTMVGDQVVHLSQLTGREFFDAVVSLDRVNAVVVRTRGQ